MNIKEKRDSRIEFLRIICMFLIVLSHFSLYGNWSHIDNFSPIETVRTFGFEPVGQAAAACFFIITGYFSNNNRTLENRVKKSFNKFMSVWTQMFFYSTVIGIIVFFSYNSSLIELIKSFLPFSLNRYWFVTCYLLLTLLAPYLDLIGDNLDKNGFKKLLLLLFILQVPAMLNNGIINQFLIALLGYFCGKYINKNRNLKFQFKKSALAMAGVGIFIIELISIYVLRLVGFAPRQTMHFTVYVLAFLLAITWFLITIETKKFSNEIINRISKSVFAVYLITEQPTFRNILWTNVLNVQQYHASLFFPLQGLVVVLFLFAICIIIDFIRIKVCMIFNQHQFMKY